MKPVFSVLGILSAILVSGCVGGTTYGTGVGQEEQTLKDVYNMFTLKSERKNIDYSPRPDLVVPANRNALPEPLDSEATASNTEWPETPEERIARIRAAAGEVDPRTGEMSVQERLRKKEGIRIEPGYTDNPEAAKAQREEVLKRKAELAMSVGPNRKFLTEPPIDYRIPASSAPSGEEAYTPEERAAMKKAERERIARERAQLGR